MCYYFCMLIRKAETKDIDEILHLLSDVLELHVRIRPDIFESGHTKYTKKELIHKLNEENFHVYVGEISNKVVAYAMCVIELPKFTHTMKKVKTMYIDDIEVNPEYRGQGLGRELFEFLKKEAKRIGCYNITLNEWEGNDGARKFYEKLGMKPQKTTLEFILKH